MYHANKENIKLRIYVERIGENCVIKNIQKSITVQKLKELIEVHTGVPSSLLQLYYLDECPLLSTKSLRYFHVQHDAKLIARIWRTHEQLVVAAKQGNWEVLEKELASKGVNICTNESHHDPERCLIALYIACYYGNHEIVEKLLKIGVSYRRQLESGREAITVAALNGNIKCVELLLSRKVRPHEWNNERLTLTNWELQDRTKATLDRIARIETSTSLLEHSRFTNSQHYDSGFSTWFNGRHAQRYLCEILTGNKPNNKNDGRPVFRP